MDSSRALPPRQSGPVFAAPMTALCVFVATHAQAADTREQSPPGPGQAPSSEVRIWYRSSEGCPNGDAFVERLRALGRTATLARVGDRVDFVVTLAAQPEGGEGHLERQTTKGTVAIRQLRSERCEDVAEALALSLELALSPTTDTAPATEHDTAAPPPQAMAEIDARARPGEPPPSPAGGDDSMLPAPSEPGVRDAGGAVAVGAQAQLVTGLAPAVLPGASLFAELGGPGSEPRVRLSVQLAYGWSDVASGEVEVGELAARLEGCAWGWHGEAGSLQPCGGVELGALQASSTLTTGQTDRGLWAAGAAHLRAAWRASARLWPEAQVGVLLPLVRYRLGVEGAEAFRTEPVLVQLSVGVRWSP